jgi:hypothetical protein
LTIYRYASPSPIDSITFRKTENGSVRAYVHAGNGFDSKNAAEALQSMREQHYTCTAFLFEGKPMLEVRNFGKERDLLETLKPYLSGEPKVAQEKPDKLTWLDWFKKRTLQLSGITYLVGDYGFMKYNYKEADKLGMTGAFCYFLGTLALVGYGRNDQSDLQVRDLSKDLERFLCKQGVPAPKESALHHAVEEKDKTWLESAHEFGKKYPSELFNSITALAGMFVAASAYKGKISAIPKIGMDAKAIREMRHEGWMDFGLGTITAISGIFATLVKEKNPDPDEPPKKGLSWLWQKIQQHPLAIAGGGYSIATLCHAGSTWKAYKEAKRVNDLERLSSVPGRALFVAMALTSEGLLAISSKGHGEGVVSDNSVDHTALAIAADFIARQPAHAQQDLIKATTQFLGEAKHLAMKNEEVARILTQQVQAMRNNPWMVQDHKHQAPSKEQPLIAQTMAPLPPIPDKTHTSWVEKTASSLHTPAGFEAQLAP